MTDMAEIIGNPTELGVVEAVWTACEEDTPATPEQVEWNVLKFWAAADGEGITGEEARQYMAAALDAGEVRMYVSPDLGETLFVLSDETYASVSRRYEYWTQKQGRELRIDVHQAVLYACERYHDETEGEWPPRSDLVRAVIQHCDACPEMAEEMVALALVSGALTHCLGPYDHTDYPEVAEAVESLRPYWRLRPKA